MKTCFLYIYGLSLLVLYFSQLAHPTSTDTFVTQIAFTIPWTVAYFIRRPISLHRGNFKNQLVIKFDEDELHLVTMTLYNVPGEIISSVCEKYLGNSITIDLNPLPAALYFLEVEANGNKIREQILKV